MAVKKRKISKIDEKAIDLIAREMTVDSMASDTEKELENVVEDRAFETLPNDEVVQKVATTETAPAVEVAPQTPATETNQPAELLAPKTKEELVERIADERFNNFIEEEKTLVEEQLKVVKNAHKNNYDQYIAMLKGTDYYKECVEKWKKYYQQKKDKITEEVNIEVEEVANAEARNEAVRITPNKAPKQAITPTPKPTPEPIPFEIITPEAKPEPKPEAKQAPKIVIDKTLDEAEVKHKISTIGMNVDPELRKTVEQIVLTSLYDSFDASKDRYSAELTELESTKSGPLKAKYKEMVDFRWQLSSKLVNSFTKIFDTTQNKTVLNPSRKEVKEVQIDLERNKGSMDISLVADMMLDRLYHIDLKTDKVSGVVSDLVDYLTVRVQEKLLKDGQLNFDLYKEACKKVVNKVLVDSDIAVKIVESAVVSDEKVKFLASFGEALNALKNDLKNGTYTKENREFLESLKIKKEQLEKSGIKMSDDQSEVIDRELGQALLIARRLPALLRVADEEKKNAETKKLLGALKVSQIATLDLIGRVKAETKLDKKALEKYESDNVKTLVSKDGKISTTISRDKGLRPVTDYLVMKMLEVAGAENAKGKLELFDLKEDKTAILTQDLLNALEEEREPSADFTVSLLEQMILIEHDIRESVKLEPEKFKHVQETINNLAELKNRMQFEEFNGIAQNHKEEIEKVLNDFIEISNTKEYGKARRKVNIVEETKTK